MFWFVIQIPILVDYALYDGRISNSNNKKKTKKVAEDDGRIS
jgi:hypothetical protein